MCTLYVRTLVHCTLCILYVRTIYVECLRCMIIINMKRKTSSVVNDDGDGNGDIGANVAVTRSHFVRSFQHVDGNWPSHVHLLG